MGSIIMNKILLIFTCFGGVTSLCLLFKFIIKKCIEESIKNQMDKSLAIFEQRINRQDSIYNIRIQREFAYYDKIQAQNGIIKSTVNESILSLVNEDICQFYTSQNRLKKLLKEVTENLDANRAYINQDLLCIVDKIVNALVALLRIGSKSNNLDSLDKVQYEKRAKEVVVLVNCFSMQLRKYIANLSNTSE